MRIQTPNKKFKDQIMTKLSSHLKGGIDEDDTSFTHNIPKWEKKTMAFVSPKSGTGKAQKFYYEIEDLLAAAGFNVKVIVTEYQGHAKEIIQKMDSAEFKTYYTFIIFGGDGMVSEIINGFYNRDLEKIEEQNLK